MSYQSLDQIRRQVRRARVTVRAALAAPRPEMQGVVALAPAFLAACDVFEHADSVARGAHIVATRESGDVRAALARLARRCEVARAEVMARLGAALPAVPSPGAAADELIAAGEAIEQELALREGEAWAAASLDALGPLLDAAIREHEKDHVARGALRRAELAREQAAGALRPILVALRRAVRVAFGRGSREYRELRDRVVPADPDDTGLRDAPTLPDVAAELS